MNADQFTAKYIELRDRRTKLKKQFEADDAKLKVLMTGIEEKLLEKLAVDGAKRITTAHGTVYKTYKEFVNVADWQEVLRFIKENDAYDMLEKRVSKSSVTERMEKDSEGNYRNPPPPGVNFARQETVQIRRS
jgi:hypothetical protein